MLYTYNVRGDARQFFLNKTGKIEKKRSGAKLWNQRSEALRWKEPGCREGGERKGG